MKVISCTSSFNIYWHSLALFLLAVFIQSNNGKLPKIKIFTTPLNSRGNFWNTDYHITRPGKDNRQKLRSLYISGILYSSEAYMWVEVSFISLLLCYYLCHLQQTSRNVFKKINKMIVLFVKKMCCKEKKVFRSEQTSDKKFWTLSLKYFSYRSTFLENLH